MGNIIFPKRRMSLVESSYCRIVKLPKLYNVEYHFLDSIFAERQFRDTLFSRKSFS